LAQTGIQNSPLIYILAFTITMVSTIILFRLFSGTLLLELRNETIKMDWIKKPIYSSIKSQTINLNDINNWKHQEGKGVDSFKIYLKNNQKIYIELNNLSSSTKNHEMVKTLKNFLIAKEIKKSYS